MRERKVIPDLKGATAMPARRQPADHAEPSTGLEATLVAALTAAADEVPTVARRIGPRFARAEARRRVQAYLRGLLSTVERKNGWQLAEAVGDRTPYALQHLLGRADWDPDLVRDDLRAYVVEHLGDAEAILVVDETGVVKKGVASAGVAKQYTGAVGKVENAQVGVFLAYASPKGVAFLDRTLYLPEDWTDDPARCQRAGIPATVGFATKPQLAQTQLERARATGVLAAWVTADSVYGDDRHLRMWLEAHEQAYVLAGLGKGGGAWGAPRAHTRGGGRRGWAPPPPAGGRRKKGAATGGGVPSPSAAAPAPRRGGKSGSLPPAAPGPGGALDPPIDADAFSAVAELIPLTVPEVRRLLWGVVWRAFPSVEDVLDWSAWRRHHQAVATRCHSRRRGVILP